jgi:hypothetical protein
MPAPAASKTGKFWRIDSNMSSAANQTIENGGFAF